MKSTIIIFLFILYATVVSGSPGIGIIKDSEGNIYYTDLLGYTIKSECRFQKSEKDGLMGQLKLGNTTAGYLPVILISGILLAGITIVKILTPGISAVETHLK